MTLQEKLAVDVNNNIHASLHSKLYEEVSQHTGIHSYVFVNLLGPIDTLLCSPYNISSLRQLIYKKVQMYEYVFKTES